MADEMFDALESGEKFSPSLKNFDSGFEKLLEKHFRKTIEVGVSDGYREVTPENNLSTWLDYGPLVPIESTIPVELAGYRDEMTNRIRKLLGENTKTIFPELKDSLKDQQLSFLKGTYKNLAKNWLKGESSIVEVKKALTNTLGKGKASIERVFRTETTRWFNESRAEYFQSQTTATHVQIFAVTDGRTSHICESRNGFVVPIEKARLKKYMPPFHPNCRTVQRALFASIASHRKLIERGMAMNESRFEDLPRGWAA